MSYRHLSRGIQLGIPAVRRPEAAPNPAPGATLLSHWRLDETTLAGSPTPSAVDSEGLSNGLYLNATVGHAGLISGSPTGTSARFATDGYVRIPHHADWQVEDYSVVVYAQIHAAPADNTNGLLVHKDRQGMPGGFQIGVFNNAGVIRPKLYTRNASAATVYVGDINGIAGVSVSVGIAFMLVAVKTAAGVTVYLNKVAVGSSSNGIGWVDNDEQISIAIRRAGIQNNDGFNGYIDEVRVYEGALTQSEINALPDAVTLVVPPPPAESDQANCHVEPGTSTVVVSTMADLEAAINAAPAGRHILIAAGTYTGGTRTFNRDGTEANPIVIRPQGALGSVTINAAVWTIANTASWLCLSKLYFTNSFIQLMGDHNRITRCRFRSISRQCIRVNDSNSTAVGARDCRIDHCDFSDQTTHCHVIHLRPQAFANGNAHHLLIDYCYFHDLNPPNTNEVEAAVIGTFSNLATYDLARGTTMTIDHCLVDDVHYLNSQSGELILYKWGGVITRFSTFTNTNMAMQIRAGGHMEFRSNWFEVVGEVEAYSEDNLWIGNRITGAENLPIFIGNGTWEDQLADAVPSNRYEPCTNCQFIGNRLGSGRLRVGHWFNTTDAPSTLFPAENILLEANTRDSGGDAHIIVTQPLNPSVINLDVNPTTTAPFTPAVKLTAADVGLEAADPLCA